MPLAVQVHEVAKRYRLGQLDRSSFFSDWRRKLRGGGDEDAEDAAKVFWALRGVSFEIEQGEIVGILGRNGAGKSTLLKILAQITAPSSGHLALKGRVASLLEVGTGFHPELSGRDNVFLNGAILGMTRREIVSKFDEIVAFSGVEQFIDTPVKRYSSGMRVRLAFAVAAHLEAELLMIDEVLAVGDASFQQKCLGKIGEVAGSGRTVLFVSHNAATIESLCRRGIVLERGRVAFDGTQTEALRYYAEANAPKGISLRDRTDRTGSGEIRVVAAELRDPSGGIINTAKCGDDVAVWLHFENPQAVQYPHLNARLNIRTTLGAPVFTQSNQLVGTSFGALPDRGAFVCHIPRLPLPAASYHVEFQISTRYRQAEMIDAVENAFELSVENGDFFGTGMVPAQVSGAALVPARWHLETSARG